MYVGFFGFLNVFLMFYIILGVAVVVVVLGNKDLIKRVCFMWDFLGFLWVVFLVIIFSVF